MTIYLVSISPVGSTMPIAKMAGVAGNMDGAANGAWSVFSRSMIAAGQDPKRFTVTAVEALGEIVFDATQQEPPKDDKDNESGFASGTIELG